MPVRRVAGEVLAESFRLVRRLGRGGMGEVWEAEHLRLHAPVAIKLVDPRLIEPSSGERDVAVARMMREARTAALLRSPHVVQVLDVGMDRNVPYVVMEFLAGQSLGERLEKAGTLAPEVVARVIAQVASALAKAHDVGIVHRDLKPSNIVLVEDGGKDFAKVVDFGIVKSTLVRADTSASFATPTGVLLGTPQYMSPEHLDDPRRVDFRTDLWALAVIAYESLVGRRPFDGRTLPDVVTELARRRAVVPDAVKRQHPGFAAWFEKATARDPKARFATALELAAALTAAIAPRLEAEGAEPVSSGTPEPVVLPAGTRRRYRELPSALLKCDFYPKVEVPAEPPSSPPPPRSHAPEALRDDRRDRNAVTRPGRARSRWRRRDLSAQAAAVLCGVALGTAALGWFGFASSDRGTHAAPPVAAPELPLLVAKVPPAPAPLPPASPVAELRAAAPAGEPALLPPPPPPPPPPPGARPSAPPTALPAPASTTVWGTVAESARPPARPPSRPKPSTPAATVRSRLETP